MRAGAAWPLLLGALLLAAAGAAAAAVGDFDSLDSAALLEAPRDDFDAVLVEMNAMAREGPETTSARAALLELTNPAAESDELFNRMSQDVNPRPDPAKMVQFDGDEKENGANKKNGTQAAAAAAAGPAPSGDALAQLKQKAAARMAELQKAAEALRKTDNEVRSAVAEARQKQPGSEAEVLANEKELQQKEVHPRRRCCGTAPVHHVAVADVAACRRVLSVSISVSQSSLPLSLCCCLRTRSLRATCPLKAHTTPPLLFRWSCNKKCRRSSWSSSAFP